MLLLLLLLYIYRYRVCQTDRQKDRRPALSVCRAQPLVPCHKAKILRVWDPGD